MNKFSDFAEDAALDGEKMKIAEILNKEIAILNYSINRSKYAKGDNQSCLKLQFELNNEKHITFSGSNVLINQLERYRDKLPFIATIVKIGNYYSLS